MKRTLKGGWRCKAHDGACNNKYYAKGYCKKHYTQVARYGRLTPECERGVVRECIVEGCGRTDTIGQYCRKHARQIRMHGRLTPEREHGPRRSGCAVAGCTGKHRAKGYCAKHYNSMRWQQIKAVMNRIRSEESALKAAAQGA